MSEARLRDAITTVPAGRWAVGVSGGADSVALLELLRAREDLSLHVVHLDHETRGDQSAADAQFVRQLAEKWGLGVTIARRSEIEISETRQMNNTSARYRAARLELFRRVVAAHALEGVMLAHQMDDQAETVLQRLVRGVGRAGLAGMSPRTTIGGVVILRPLLDVPRSVLRAMLVERGVAWREDSSNESMVQQRNRARALLANHPALTAALMELSHGCESLTQWMRASAPTLGETFSAVMLSDLSPPLAREAARRWLRERAGGDVEIPPAAVERLIDMAADAASTPRQDFPGGVHVSRRKGMISV